MASFVVPPGWPVPPQGWKPSDGWQPDPQWGPPPADWSFWQEEANEPVEAVQTAPESLESAGPKNTVPREKSRRKKAATNAKTLLASAQKLQTRNEERIKQATVKTREILQDERTKATLKRIVEDERTKTILVTGGMIGLAAARAALIERNAGAAATAAAAEYKRVSEASRTSRVGNNDQSSPPNLRQSGSTGPVSADTSTDASPSSSGNPSSSSAAASTWNPPTWSDTPKPETDDRVVQAPVRMLMNKSGMFIVEKHPRLPELSIEATQMDRITYGVAIEWKHQVQRIYYASHQIPDTWTAIQHDDFFVPMELRRDEFGHVWCRWLEPTRADREAQRENPYIPMEPGVAYRNMSNALRVLGGGTRWRV